MWIYPPIVVLFVLLVVLSMTSRLLILIVHLIFSLVYLVLLFPLTSVGNKFDLERNRLREELADALAASASSIAKAASSSAKAARLEKSLRSLEKCGKVMMQRELSSIEALEALEQAEEVRLASTVVPHQDSSNLSGQDFQFDPSLVSSQEFQEWGLADDNPPASHRNL